MTDQQATNLNNENVVQNAKNLFRYLAEIKALQSPSIRDYREYEKVIWLSDIPREEGCFCKAWALFGEPGEDDGSGAWISVRKPNLTPPPELPDGIDSFVNLNEWRDSSKAQPSLKEPSREELVRHFLSDEDIEPDVEEWHIDENEDIFEEYVRYVDEEWRPWALKNRENANIDEAPPSPSELIQPWLSSEHLQNYNLEEPPIHEQISVEVDTKFKEAKLLLTENWERYLSDEWLPWAEADRLLQEVQKIYNELYTTYQSFQRLGEQYEVVLAFGLLAWTSARSGRVRRHILVCDVSLSFDAGAGQLYVTSNPNGLQLRAETDMLEPADRPQQPEIEIIEEEIGEVQDDVWDEAFLRHLPRAFVNALPDDRGQFEMSLGRKSPDGDIPRIDLAPALILRRRSQHGYIRLLNEIEAHIDKSSDLPRGIREIIDPETAEAVRRERAEAAHRSQADIETIDEPPMTHSSGGPTKPVADNETYFPLPANKEQYEIAYRLNYGRGVLVQGPPGTGKTHTITNLICHLLAQGRRVLITSETPRALQSLQSKFQGPAAPIADLCVLLLGNDAGSIEALERSVQAINTKLAAFDKHQAQEVICELKEDLLKVRAGKRKAEQDLKAIREHDTYKHSGIFNRYSGTLQRIAQIVRKEKSTYGWFADDIDDSVVADDIITMDADAFARAWFRLPEPPDIDRNIGVIDSARLPSAEVFANAVRELHSQERTLTQIRTVADSVVADGIKNCDQQAVQTLRVALHRILTGMRQLEEHVFPWAVTAGKDIVMEQDRRWRELLQVSQAEIARCDEHIRDVASAQIEGVKDSEVRRLLRSIETLKRHIEEGGKLKIGLFQSKPTKEAFKAIAGVTLDGLPIRDINTLERFAHWLIAKDALTILKQHWGDLAQTAGGALNLQLAEFADRIEPLELAVELHDHVTRAQKTIDAMGAFGAPVWHSSEQLQSYVNALDLHSALDQLAKLHHAYDDMQSAAATILKFHPKYHDAIIASFDTRDSATYAANLQRVKRYNKAARARNELFEIARVLRRILPNTFQAFLASKDADQWSSRFRNLASAMDWRRVNDWVTKLCDPNSAETINKKIDAFDREEHRIIGELAAEKAWGHCLDRLNEIQRQSLMAWLQAIAKIGKGTGKYAERHRATAREELKHCQPAIPAWVMPMHRVVENVGANPEQFDIAVIDEASQSGPEAIILNYIAKKVVVVGDDKQISPLNVGINHEEVEHFRKRYLSGIAHSQSFDLNSSYFSQAQLRFPNYIRLKEHFRCMPEIILFSNNNFYATDPLIPLRQFGGGRLLPVVKAEYVQDGFRIGRGSKIHNEPEARRIVELIAECCEDPSYEGKKMGVICLAGGQQVQLIQQLLIDEIEVQEIEARNLLVGRPYTFQGDERDVIFLSMINAPENGRRCRVVSGSAREREFNVAASRARDQLILVHSATLNDLSPDCLQHKLLKHCQNPEVEPPDGLSIELIREASRADRQLGSQPPPFDSWFEVDVFLRIVDRGYSVIPQYHVNPFDRSYRIDMVVVGVHGRLAVECDGDHWHGPDRYDQDMARQRELQRAGWFFWRVRGSTFYFDSDAAMVPLWEKLDRYKILPRGREPENEGFSDAPEELGDQTDDESNRTPVADNSANETSTSLLPIQLPPDQGIRKTKRRDFSAKELQDAVVAVLKSRPNNSIAVKSLTQAVCKKLSIRTRGQPWLELDKRIRHSIGVLKRKDQVKEYKSKNVRIRLNGSSA